MSSAPDVRVRALNTEALRRDGDFVLYWMIATRRLASNFALDRTIEVAEQLQKPILILEPLNVGYRWASDRHHKTILDGMREHDAGLASSPVGYYPYVEPHAGAGQGLLSALARRACMVITDDSPVFFTPQLLGAAARLTDCRVEAIDSCGMLPIHVAGRSFTAAYHFRRYLQKELPNHLMAAPAREPLTTASPHPFDSVPREIGERWPRADSEVLAGRTLASLPIDHSVGPTDFLGGHTSASARLDAFLEHGLRLYATERNDPDAEVSSGLSPALHYGHISPHEVLQRVAETEGWSPARISERADGRRQGWWGMSEAAEGFLDQLITWRELGYGYCTYEPDYHRYETLPEWARDTLETHTHDERPHLYSFEEFDAAATHDELWNAAQRQLVAQGVIHNYLRMLWGKKILEWTGHPREALEVMVELNNRYALDGRDPNSYSGIFWVMGRFDRGWPERPIFGKVRSMTSDSTRRKVKLGRYLARWGDQPELGFDR